ncbi:MAG: tRNA (N6-isopentenyl adenosine(37)-C2)-methylthiotransferase MiaB [Clostridia bacterium]|nr:tRNA (N6-isopentenyl adenosine(37)-C2)-methylthiotransferase MiaB [Clostridia bacterium]
MKKFYVIKTFGCQMNVHESEKIAGIAEELGYFVTEDDSNADLIVFNTCCIRDTAEKKILGNIGDVKVLKKKKPSLIVAVVGCMTQQNGAAEELKKKFPFVNIVLGTSNLSELSSAIIAIENRQKKRYDHILNETMPTIDETIPVKRTSGTNAWVNIMYGCNNFCTYCIVPYVRGRERSRDFSVILDEVKSLLDEGYKEITLLGQNVDSYAYENKRFVNILEEIAKLPGKFRLRFMTSHPKDFNSAVIDVIRSCDNICNNVHLPIQSGSDRILKLMNRHYDRARYMEVLNEIKQKLPHCGITTDIMVGFPTETEEDFLDTMSLVREARFSNAFTFVYSPRRGTVAAAMEQLSPAVKKDRITRLVDLQNSITKELSLEYIGRTEEVLVEDLNPKKPGFVCGRTESGRLVNFPGVEADIGAFKQVKITTSRSAALWGETYGE